MVEGRPTFTTAVTEFMADRERELAHSPEHLSTLRELLDLYARRGLLPNGADWPLYDVCPRREPCWGGRDELRPTQRARAGIAAPWLGTDYFRDRICVVGMNFHDWGGLDGHWVICNAHIEAQRAGMRGKDGRPFAYGAMAYANVLRAGVEGEVPDDWRRPKPEALAEVWQSVAFLEAVKCSPGVPRSSPFPEMFRQCPPLLLRDELRILKPRVVLLLGRPQPRDTVRPILDVRWGEHRGAIERDSFALGDARCELFSCNHPSSPRWWHSLDDLEQSIRATPIK